jgi:hypothetical protein
MMGRFVSAIFVFVAVLVTMVDARQSGAAAPAMKKYVSDQANFVMYMPEGWRVSEGQQANFRTIFVSDPSGTMTSAMFYGISPRGKDVPALATLFSGNIKKQFPDLVLPRGWISPDKKKVVFDGIYTDLQRRRKEFRVWITGGDGNFTYCSIESPEGRLAGARQLLLTILSNVRIIRGAIQTATGPAKLPMAPYRLHDGSATFLLPHGWKCQSLGNGLFLAGDAGSSSSFIVASAEAITPQMRVSGPGLVVSPYLPPAQALRFFAEKSGIARNVKLLHVIPRQDLSRLISQVYTVGPVTAEEFLYTSQNAQGITCKGYSFGISFGSRTNTSWKLWHMTVATAADRFDALISTFVEMFQSYKINDQFAQNYIAQGMARLRQMQQETARIVARNAQEIRDMMQAAYDERQRSMDYIDYQRSNYIRGNSDWISSMEGGTVYHSERWGTKNITTGDNYEGQPYNYFNFTGKNPKYNEQMQEINTRELFEKYRK